MARIACVWICIVIICLVDPTKAVDNVRHKRQTKPDIEALPSGALIHHFRKDVGSKKPTDLVILLDRSQGTNKFNFYIRTTKLIRALISQYVLLHPNYTRIAVATFAAYSTLVFDYISNNTDLNVKCHVLDAKPTSPWEEIRFDQNPAVWADTNLKAAYSHGRDILSKGRQQRPGVSQVVLAVTDGNYKSDQDPIVEVQELRDLKVQMYAIGLGNWLAPGNVRELATNASYYATFNDWNDMVNNNLTSYPSDAPAIWTGINSTYCVESCVHGACFCDALTGYSQCLCSPGYELVNNICTECGYHHYKEEYSNEQCVRCPLDYVTSTNGSVSRLQCECHPAVNTCNETAILENMCEIANPCNTTRQICVNLGNNNTECICRKGFSGPDCSVNTDNCQQSRCNLPGRARCFDRPDSYYCACAYGFKGRYCDETTNECSADLGLCENNSTCTDKENDFLCTCRSGWLGRYCQDAVTTTTQTTTTTTLSTTTTTPTTTPSTVPTTTERPLPTPVQQTKKDDTLLIIIIACAAGGVVLIAIVIAIIVSVVMYRRRKRAEREAADAKNELAETLKRAQKEKRTSTYRRYRNTLTKTLSQAFSGFFRRKTVRQYEGNPEEGLPSAPAKRRPRPDLLQSEVVGGTEEMVVMDDKQIYVSQAQTNGMEGWTSYLKDLQRSGLITSGAIVDVDGGPNASTSDWSEFTSQEADKCKEVLFSKRKNVPLFLGTLGEYFVTENDGETVLGTDSATSHKTVAFQATRKYVVALLGESRDSKSLKKEMQWITDHMKGEGY